MADRIRAFDWASSLVGPPDAWPQSLRTAVAQCLSSHYPMYVWWGPELIAFYNDAYVPIAGSLKHPRSLGRPAREMWTEIWETFSGFVDEIRRTGRAIWRDNMPLVIERSGVVEEAYFTFSFGPAYDERGEVAGIVCTCNETTTTVAREAHFREMIDTSPSIVWVTDAAGLCTYLSRQWYAFTGRTLEQDLGLGWVENVHPEDRARSAQLFAEANSRREQFSFDYRLRRSDGTYRWAMVSGFPRVAADGEYLGFIGNVIDVHDRKMLEARFRSVAESIGVGVWYCDLPFAELMWDRTVKEHFWLAPTARVTIETFYERIHPDDRERTRGAIDHSIANHAAYDIDYRTTNPADERQLKHIRAIGWTDYDESGNPVRFDGVTLDVTDEKKSQRLLRESQLRYELATRATKNAIWDWDLATNVIAWNEAIHTEYGHLRTAEQSTATWWYEHIHPEDRDNVVSDIHVAIDAPGESYWFAEYRYLRADGSYASVLDRGFILRDEHGRALRMIGAMEDMTSRKRAEEGLRSAVRVRDEFLSIASHELKTPLTSLKLQAEYATRTMRADDLARSFASATRFVEQAHKQIGRLSRLVDDMLDISRLATGKLTLEREPVDLALIAAESVEQFRPQFEAAGARLDISADGSMWVNADRARIEQVLVNLLSNALKYGDAKPVRVGLSAEGGRVRLAVSDEGMGIFPEHQTRVFDRFERAVPATAISGLGLGLYISKQIVEMHDGHIVLASAPGKGSTFTVDLPAA